MRRKSGGRAINCCWPNNYTGARDERAEPIYLRLLEQIKGEELRKREVPALYGLHSYYLAMGRTEQAGDTLMSAPQYTTKLSVLGNTPVEAARLYRVAGLNEKAATAYALAEKSEFGWSAGMALYDQARMLMARGKHEEARKLLKKPVEGAYSQQVEVGLLSLLGQSYYETGDFKEARRYSQLTIEHASSLTLLSNEGLEQLVFVARDTLKSIEQWEKQGVIVEPRELKVTVGPDQKSSITRRLRVRSFRDVSITASSDNPLIKVWVNDSGWAQENTNKTEKETEVIVEIALAGLQSSLETAVIFRSSKQTNMEVRMPVQIEAVKK